MQNINMSILALPELLRTYSPKKIMLVCDKNFERLLINGYIKIELVSFVVFNEFSPNPKYEEIVKGVNLFCQERCDFILAVGGGSSIDAAKCIKLFCTMDPEQNYLSQPYSDNGIPIVAIPTTAGTGSESTRFAVIYFNGEKQSIFHDSILPSEVILEPAVLKTLPLYQRICTMLDALSQAIESWWSVNSTPESKLLSQKAVTLIHDNLEDYLMSPDSSNEVMLRAANYAGQAINIAQTTAAHAMSYKLTSMFNMPHGHAVALCLPAVWRYMVRNLDQCIDNRGSEYLHQIFLDIAAALGHHDVIKAICWFEKVLEDLDITAPDQFDQQNQQTLEILKVLTISVNPVRLKNNPVRLDNRAVELIYKNILNISGGNE